LGQDSRDRTAGKKLLGQDMRPGDRWVITTGQEIEDMTTRTYNHDRMEHLGRESWDRSVSTCRTDRLAVTGQPGQDKKERMARTRSKFRTALTGQPGRDNRGRTARKGVDRSA
jgi:hypothetical protein